jgi:hypothetical protein
MAKRLLKKHAVEIFKQVDLMEDLHYANIRALERTMLTGYDGLYEIAIVGGDIVGIGKITKTGKKLVFHR